MSDCKTMQLWDYEIGCLLHTLKNTDWYFGDEFSPDSNYICSSCYDKGVQLWNIKSGKYSLVLNLPITRVWSVAFSPDIKTLCTGSEDNIVRVYDTTTGKLKYSLEGHQNDIFIVTFSPDGKLIASGSEDASVRLWNATTGKLNYILNGHTEVVNSVIFSPNGKYVCSGSEDTTLKLWDVCTGALICNFEIGDNNFKVAFSPASEFIVSISEALIVQLWLHPRTLWSSQNASFFPNEHYNLCQRIEWMSNNKTNRFSNDIVNYIFSFLCFSDFKL